MRKNITHNSKDKLVTAFGVICFVVGTLFILRDATQMVVFHDRTINSNADVFMLLGTALLWIFLLMTGPYWIYGVLLAGLFLRRIKKPLSDISFWLVAASAGYSFVVQVFVVIWFLPGLLLFTAGFLVHWKSTG